MQYLYSRRSTGLSKGRLFSISGTVFLLFILLSTVAFAQRKADPAARKRSPGYTSPGNATPAARVAKGIRLKPLSGPRPAAPAACTNVMLDGGFENGGIPSSIGNPATSTNFATPLCDAASCGTGDGASPPRTGAIWAWFGGVPLPETATIGQTVNIAASSAATLNFHLRIGTVSAPFTDVLNVRVDGNIVQSFAEPAVAEGAYTLRTINLNAFANGANHQILFEYIGPTRGMGSFVVDDVTLDVCGVTPPPTTAGQLIISEFRVRGPSDANDEFIELYNTTGAVLITQAADASAGLAVAASDGTARCVVPNGTIIPAGGHFLCTNSVAYSLANYPSGNNGVVATTATGNLTYTTDIPDNAGIAIFNNATGGASFSTVNRLDAVGSASEANTTYKEGTGYPDLTPLSIDFSFYRDTCGKQGSTTNNAPCTTGLPIDTDNNANDFVFVDTNGTNIGAGQRVGAPGPENLSSPIQRNATIKLSLVDAGCATSGTATSACARSRDLTSNPGNNSNFGTLSIRRRVTNNTNAAVTRLRFRIVDLTTFPVPAGTADLRVLTSTTFTASLSGGGTTVITGTTLEQPPSQFIGGGFNSSLSADTITLAAPLAVGNSINVQFLVGVQQTGSYRFFINVEALP